MNAGVPRPSVPSFGFGTGGAGRSAAPVARESLEVLVVDDFQNMRATLKQLLLRAGFSAIDFAVNARSAFEAIQAKAYDLILCDYNLGEGADGEQILESGRSQGWIGPGSAVVMVTAEVTGEMVLSALEIEPDGYLTKPFSPQQLDLRVDRGLRRRQPLRRLDAAWRRDDPDGLLAELRGPVQQWRPDERRIVAHLAWRLGDLAALTTVLDAQDAVGATTWSRFFRAGVDEVRGDLEGAERRLVDLLRDVPQFLPAADRLAAIERRTGRLDAARARIDAARDGSEKSFSRQTERARVAAALQQADDRQTAFDAASALAERLVPFDPLMAVRWLDLANEIEMGDETVKRVRARIQALMPQHGPWWRWALDRAAEREAMDPNAAGWPDTAPPTRLMPWLRSRVAMSAPEAVDRARWTRALDLSPFGGSA